MTTTFASGKSFRLTRKLNPADTTMYGNLSVWVTAGRIFLQNDNQKEWISFTGNSLVGTEYVYTGLTRGLSQTADPATSGTGLTWLANQQGVLVAMHDQIIDKSQGITPVSITTTQRDALTPSNGAFIYNATAGLPQIYYGGAWYDFNTAGSATPNASETVAGKVEIATQAQVNAGTDTGETGAKLVIIPSTLKMIGEIRIWTTAAAPTSWLICDGSSLLRSTYADLFAVIGTTYGAADGTHFNIPDFRGRSPLGSGTGTATGATAHALGETPTSWVGGEEKHTLLATEIPAHTHSTSIPGTGGAGWTAQSLANETPTTAQSFSTDNGTGGGLGHNIMSPIVAVNFIIRAL